MFRNHRPTPSRSRRTNGCERSPRDNRLAVETAVHETARQIVELIAAARERIEKLGGDRDEAAERITELVTADEEQPR